MYHPNHEPHYNTPYLLTEEESANPRSVIRVFFDCAHYPVQVQLLLFWFKNAFGYRRLRRKTLLRVHDFKGQLLRLLEAASLMTDKGKSTIPAKETNIMNQRWYVRQPAPGYCAWDYFPRFLTRQQYRNPYLALQQCTAKRTLPQWRTILDDVYDAACQCSTNGDENAGTIFNDVVEPNIHLRCLQLLQLVEAAHLILVREKPGR